MRYPKAVFSTTISEAKKNLPILLGKAELYRKIVDRLEDYELGKIVKARQVEKDLAVEVSLDDLMA